jgi:hypothetical protein
VRLTSTSPCDGCSGVNETLLDAGEAAFAGRSPAGRPRRPRYDRGMASRLALLALLTAACGPTSEEAAGAVLVAVPAALGVGHLFIRLLVWLWRPLRALPLSARPVLAAMGVAAVAAGLAVLVVGEGLLEWVPAALALFGTTYLTLLFLAWRLWLHHEPASSATWSFFAPLSITVLPGIPLLYGVDGPYADAVISGWILIGYGGMVAGPVLLILVGEALLRRHRARRRTTAPR